MEQNIQRVFAILLSVVVFFLLPLYIAYEKKDDISYALALKITSSFAEQVKNNGYLTAEMYTDFVIDLGVTQNIYDIEIEHKGFQYNPVIYSYEDEDPLNPEIIPEIRRSFDYELYSEEFIAAMAAENPALRVINVDGVDYGNLKMGYTINEIVHSGEYILESLTEPTPIYQNMEKADYLAVPNASINDETHIYRILNIWNTDPLGTPDTDNFDEYTNIYTFNKGDEFNVKIVNTNTTTAESLFNLLTANIGAGAIPRVFINHGVIVTAETY